MQLEWGRATVKGMKNSRTVFTALGVLVILGFGLWGAYGSNFNAVQDITNGNASSQTCTTGFMWNGSECVTDTRNSIDHNCASNYVWNGTQCVINSGGTDPGTNGTTGAGTTGSTGTTGTTGTSGSTGTSGTTGSTGTNSGTSGTTSTNSGGANSTGSTTTGAQPSATIEPITTGQLAAVFTGYKLSNSPFTSLARAGFSQLEMSWLGAEILRTLIRNRERGITEIKVSDLKEHSQLIQEAREYVKK